MKGRTIAVVAGLALLTFVIEFGFPRKIVGLTVLYDVSDIAFTPQGTLSKITLRLSGDEPLSYSGKSTVRRLRIPAEVAKNLKDGDKLPCRPTRPEGLVYGFRLTMVPRCDGVIARQDKMSTGGPIPARLFFYAHLTCQASFFAAHCVV